MDNCPQQQENRTNSLSEEHVESAIDTVLANQPQTYEEFVNAFTVLTPEDIASFHVPGGNRGESFEAAAAAGLSEVVGQVGEPSSETESQLDCHDNKRQTKQEEELEIEELGEDMVYSEEVETSGGTPRTSKYIQVDNYLDEPDSESDVISDDDDSPLEFDDDSTAQYVASFDTEKEVGEGAAKSSGPVCVTPEMIQRATDESDLETTSTEDVPVSNQPYPGPYPGEIDEDELATPHQVVSTKTQHITQLPHGTRPTQPSDIPVVAEKSQEENELPHSTSFIYPSDIAAEADQDESQATLDTVEAFAIDPDFDYDNVTLTPKWQLGEGPPIGT